MTSTGKDIASVTAWWLLTCMRLIDSLSACAANVDGEITMEGRSVLKKFSSVDNRRY